MNDLISVGTEGGAVLWNKCSNYVRLAEITRIEAGQRGANQPESLRLPALLKELKFLPLSPRLVSQLSRCFAFHLVRLLFCRLESGNLSEM